MLTQYFQSFDVKLNLLCRILKYSRTLKKSELLEYWSLKQVRQSISIRTVVKVYKRFFSTTTGYSSADCDSLSHQLRTPNTKHTLPWNLELQPPHWEGPIVASEIENCRVLISELRVVFSVLTRINFCFTYSDFSTSSDYSLPFHFSLRFRLRCCCSSLPL